MHEVYFALHIFVREKKVRVKYGEDANQDMHHDKARSQYFLTTMTL